MRSSIQAMEELTDLVNDGWDVTAFRMNGTWAGLARRGEVTFAGTSTTALADALDEMFDKVVAHAAE